MDLKDATLILVTESAAHPAVASIAQSAYDRSSKVSQPTTGC